MVNSTLKSKLAAWAETKPTIKALYVFGSRAKGTANPESDLDLAFSFVDDIDNADSELIENSEDWKKELTNLTGLHVKDVYNCASPIVGPECTLVFQRKPSRSPC
jgi:predicted nucleotidyltransferase